MKRTLSLKAIFLNVLLALLIGTVTGVAFEAPIAVPVVALIIFTVGTLVPIAVGSFTKARAMRMASPVGLFMALQTEVWIADAAENIYPKNSFINQSIDDSAWLKNKTVHLPQSGSKPNVEKNRVDLPAALTKREDADLTYDVDVYTTDPILLENTEEVELSYNKRASVLFDHMEQIKTSVAEDLLIKWAPTLAANQVRTSGDSVAATGSAQTGNRKKITLADLIAGRTIMDRMDIDQQGRIMVIEPGMYGDLLAIDQFKTLEQLGSKVISDGAIGRIMGYDVFVRSSVLRYTNDGTPVPNAYGAAAGAGDNLGALLYHKNFVRSAFGNPDNGGILLFDREKDPQFFGDVFSMLVRAGGQKKYTNERGVVAIVQTTP